MGIIAKQSSWNFIVLYIGVVLGAVNNFVMPNAMDEEELGVLRIFLSLMLLGGQVALFGGVHSVLRFYPKYGKETKTGFGMYIFKNTIISTFLAIGIYLIIKDFLIEAYKDSSLFGEYYFLYIPLLVLFVFQEFFGAYVRSLLKSVFQIVVKEVLLRIYQGVLFLLLMFQYIQFDLFLTLYVFGYAIIFLPFLIYTLKADGSNFKLRSTLPKKAKREMSGFAGTIFLTGISGAILGNIDIVMIGALAPILMDLNGVELAGVYGTMLFMSMLILVPFKSIQNIAVPLISRAWANKDFDDLKSIYNKSSLNMSIFGALTFIGLWINMDFILTLFPSHFGLGRYAFLLLALGNLMQATLGINTAIIMNGPKYWVIGIGTPLLAILVVVTNLIFIPSYGMEGAAFATALSRFVFNIILYVFTWTSYNMQPFTWRHAYIAVISVLIILLTGYLPVLEFGILDFLMRSAVALIIFVPAVLVPKLSPEVNDVFWKALGFIGIKKKPY